MSVYVIDEHESDQESKLAPIAYRTFEQAKAYITARFDGWEILNEYGNEAPNFDEDNATLYTAESPRPANRPVGKTYIWAQNKEEEREIPIIIHKLTLEDDADDPTGPDGGRRRRSNTARTVRMKKSEYLREHHHLFRVLRNPTRRALNAELRKQKRELKERGLKG